MNKNFELWLDESGDFENQHELEGTTRKPSLIGGFLVEEEVADKIDFGGLIDSNRNHAMELEEDDKKNYVLPVLQRMKSEYNAAQVFFENQEYHDEATSRQLYLSMMAEGILQLLQRLNARYESVGLRVTIAQRQDVTAEAGNQRIRENEYKKALEYCIKRKQRERRAMLHPDCEVSFEICRASDSMRLQLADFACNTRLTRDSHAFKDVRSEVEALYSTAFLFTLTEVGSQNFIQQCLAQNNYSDAILELYTTKDNLEHGKILSLMAERMKNCSYRLIKSQMKNCVADLLVYALNEDDYEVGEALLKNLLDELIPFLKKNGMPQEHLHFSILLNLSDMYLREGDIYEANRTLEKCRRVQEQFGNYLEELMTYYQLVEKEALLAIDQFCFEEGRQKMKTARQLFEHIMKFIEKDELLSMRFPVMKSEYYGDALCMEIYAMLFQQRFHPELYSEMCRLSDIALNQYPGEEGELERHRQYRSHIELEAGKYKSAMKWLAGAICLPDEEPSEEMISKFLRTVVNGQEMIGAKYYLMYYLLILARTAREDKEFARMMFLELKKNKNLMELGGLLKKTEEDLNGDISLEGIQMTDSGISYHPEEIIFWKYGEYLASIGNASDAIGYFTSALNVCWKYNNYLTLNLTGLGIAAERIVLFCRTNNRKAAKNAYKRLLEACESLQAEMLPNQTREFVQQISKMLEEGKNVQGGFDEKKLLEIANMVTY